MNFSLVISFKGSMHFIFLDFVVISWIGDSLQSNSYLCCSFSFELKIVLKSLPKATVK